MAHHNARCRNFSWVYYGKSDEVIKKFFTEGDKPDHWAYILHDKDIIPETGLLKNKHYHLVFHFENPRSIEETENRFKDLIVDDSDLLLHEKCNDLKGAFLYLIHSGRPEKYQYEYSSIHTDCLAYFENVVSVDDSIRRILKYITEKKRKVSYTELVRHFGSLLFFTHIAWLQIIEEHNNHFDSFVDRQAKSEKEIDDTTITEFDKCLKEHIND